LHSPIEIILFLENTNSTKFLGIHIDENLNFKNRVEIISNKIQKYVGLLFRPRLYLPADALKTLYCSLILPHANYGIEVWRQAVIEYLSFKNALSNF